MHPWWILVFLGLVGCNAAEQRPVEHIVPKHPIAVTCYIGKLDSGRSCSSTPTHLDPNLPNAASTSALRCGDTGGKISEVEWHFLGTGDGGDRYRVIRRFPVDEAGMTTAEKEVTFAGERVIVFRDDVHTVVLESPKK